MLNGPEYIEVTPAAELRTAFARWAVAADPMMRTTSLNTFAVPYALFTAVPEEVLVGALIDGHPYRHVEEGDLMVHTPAPEPVAFTDVVEVATEEEAEDPFAVEDELHVCIDCGDPFASASGLKRHRTRKHKE